jgi:oligopeptide transport system ATP-binding protein
VQFDGQDITTLTGADLRARRRGMQLIFQDPYASLNPRMTVGSIIAEPMQIHGLVEKKDRNKRVQDLLQTVGLNPYFANRYPHEFSGGQRQRIGIARALAVEPQLIVCDEAVSALDVSVQAQVVNLLMDLQEEFGLSYLFVAHDLAVVEHISHRVAVMYLGRIVELADTASIFARPQHPYTAALLSAVPVPDPRVARKRIILTGDVPSPVNPPPGCRFHTRCPYAFDRCRVEVPAMREVAPGHIAACHLREGVPVPQ